MRKRNKNSSISVHAISGTEVILLGLNTTEESRKNLIGFSIQRFDHKSNQTITLANSNKTPIQKFLWGDYVVNSGQTYTYSIKPVYRITAKRNFGEKLSVTIKTEKPDDGEHGIYFNRGVAGSQAYSRKFSKYRKWYLTQHSVPGDEHSRPRKARATEFIKPEDIPSGQGAYEWLSRGLEEGLMGFLAKAKNSDYALRAAVYEFTYVPAIQAFVDALERGVDVKIVHHSKRVNVYTLKQNFDAKNITSFTVKKNKIRVPDSSKSAIEFDYREAVKYQEKDEVAKAADSAVSKVGLKRPDDPESARNLLGRFDKMMIERTNTTISHNKFVVLLQKDKPVAVWTGSTNFTEGGIFGQSNVGHIVRDEKVAQKYLAYWQKLETDPIKKTTAKNPSKIGIQNWTVSKQADLKSLPRNQITPIFSPRLPKKKGSMLDWYAQRLDSAKHSVFFTAAFSVADQFLDILQDVKMINGKPYKANPYQRYLLLEGIHGLMEEKYPVLARCPQNRIAWGDTLRNLVEDEDFIETLTGLNDHVNYLHTKYMLIDPLGDDPIVISGSANFSTASTESNDENMLIIRGNKRVADIYLGEFMRLFNHFLSRNKRNSLSRDELSKQTTFTSDDSWTNDYFSDSTSPKYQERMLFS